VKVKFQGQTVKLLYSNHMHLNDHCMYTPEQKVWKLEWII